MGGVLAIDFGDKKTGFAVADALRIAVSPLSVIRAEGRGTELLEHIHSLVAERDVETLLVGLPLQADGLPGDRARITREFIDRLRARFEALRVVAYDERFTTREAESRLIEAGYRRREIAARKDSWSAWVLLTDWIANGEPDREPETFD